MLKLDHVTYRHVKSAQPYDFSLVANPGDIVCIMGESGSGKSTLLDLIAGFLRPESGSLDWGSKNLTPLPPEVRPISILFQNNNLFDHLTAAQNVAVGINPARTISSNEREQVRFALEQVGQEEQANQRASTLSGGQQQRIALARAIARNKPLLLLDEPFTGLDDTTKADMLNLVRKQAVEQMKCILMVTHDLSDVDALASHKYVIRNKVIEELT